MTASEALGVTLLHSLWQGALLAALFAVFITLVRAPVARHWAGCLALSAMLVCFAITLLHFLPFGGSNGLNNLKPSLAPWGQMPPGGDGVARFPGLIPWLPPIWLTGVCLFYLRYAVGWVSLLHLKKRRSSQAPARWEQLTSKLASELRLSRPVHLLESIMADTPIVIGHLRPAILLPLGFLANLPAQHVEAILLHELAHIRRSDYLINALQRLLEGLFFYHPAVWWISHVISTERENCCDDMVVALRGDAHGYAVALTALEQNRLQQQWSARSTAVAATGGNLMKRIKRLLYPGTSGSSLSPTVAAAILMLTTAMVISAWHTGAAQNKASEQSAWKNWLNEDVVYIISDQEKTAFERLTTDDERQHFVAQFWERRNPTPGSADNTFKMEHYRRIAYANDHFLSGIPGWKTDRGRVYIKFGPPDEIDSHPHGGNYTRPESEGGGTVATYPFEDWRYAKFEGVGNLDIEFVDSAGTGELRMTLDPKEKYRR